MEKQNKRKLKILRDELIVKERDGSLQFVGDLSKLDRAFKGSKGKVPAQNVKVMHERDLNPLEEDEEMIRKFLH